MRGIRAMGTHGLLPEERDRAQPFEVDVELWLDLRAAGQSDDLEDTVDYGQVVSQVSAVIANEQHNLLERLAARICEVALANPKVRTAEVAVRKLRPPVPADLDHVEVRIRRGR
ncbi:MAG: dihydroneopterin aldolase [Acidimicrobiales bacterium]